MFNASDYFYICSRFFAISCLSSIPSDVRLSVIESFYSELIFFFLSDSVRSFSYGSYHFYFDSGFWYAERVISGSLRRYCVGERLNYRRVHSVMSGASCFDPDSFPLVVLS